MKREAWRTAGWRWFALLALLAAGWGTPAQAAVTVIEQAQLTLHIAGRAPTGQATVALPYEWSRQQGAVDGEARFTFQVPVADPAVPLALFVPSLGNSFRVTVNGRTLARFGTFPPNPYDDAAFEPQLFVLPPPDTAGPHAVEIAIAAQSARQGGLSLVLAGPEDELRPLYERALHWQAGGARLVASASAVLGLLALLVWFRQRESLYLYYGLGELLWSVQTARVLFTHAPLPWPWWGVLPLAAFQAAVPLLCRFALTVVGQGDGRLARLMGWLAWAAPAAAALGILVPWLWLMPMWRAMNLVAGLAMVALVVRAAWRKPVLEYRLLAVAGLLTVLCGVRDAWVLRTSSQVWAEVPWTRFAWVGFGISLAWIIAERLRRQARSVAAMNASLEKQLAERNAALEAAFAHERESEKARGALEERQRLLRDMHDGVGAHISTAIRQLQSGQADRDEVLLTLRDSLDQLKLSIDAMHLEPGDVTGLLANVRYRLEPRLQAAGITLAWNVDALAPLPGLDAAAMRQLQYMIFEIISNALQHAQASELRVQAKALGAGAWLSIADNGRGFDAGQPARKGLLSLHERAQAIGATLTLDSSAQGTEVDIGLGG